MDATAECTHCRVLMTSWAAPGSSVRYWQCPFCGHTHSSPYGEVFRRGAGARLVPRSPEPEPAPARLPAARPVDREWALLKARARRWFERLEADERPATGRAPAPVPCRPALAAVRSRAGRA